MVKPQPSGRPGRSAQLELGEGNDVPSPLPCTDGAPGEREREGRGSAGSGGVGGQPSQRRGEKPTCRPALQPPAVAPPRRSGLLSGLKPGRLTGEAEAATLPATNPPCRASRLTGKLLPARPSPVVSGRRRVAFSGVLLLPRLFVPACWVLENFPHMAQPAGGAEGGVRPQATPMLSHDLRVQFKINGVLQPCVYPSQLRWAAGPWLRACRGGWGVLQPCVYPTHLSWAAG